MYCLFCHGHVDSPSIVIFAMVMLTLQATFYEVEGESDLVQFETESSSEDEDVASLLSANSKKENSEDTQPSEALPKSKKVNSVFGTPNDYALVQKSDKEIDSNEWNPTKHFS
jgi:hypothetical protein